MSFVIEEECSIPFTFDHQALAQKVVDFCLTQDQFPYEAEVCLTLTDDEGIRQINREHREIDASTDVLSFPMLSYTEPGNFAFLEAESEDDFNPDTGEALLGDIVISVDHVLAQAQAYGHSQEREYAFLIVHSMLHLFGYDHMEPEDAALMEAHQRALLDGLGISR